MPAPLDPSPLPVVDGAASGAHDVEAPGRDAPRRVDVAARVAARGEARADATEPATWMLARRAVDAVVQTLSAPAYTLDALRRAVVRYGRVARELALAPEEMLAPLIAAVRRALAGRTEHPADRRPDAQPAAAPAELESWVQWWAIHGYHRAD